MKQNLVVIIAAAVMVLIFGTGAYLYKTQQSKTQVEVAGQNNEALIRPYSARAGNPEAKVTIVEFMDPACRTCRAFHPLVKNLLVEHKGRVNHVIRYAPFHQGSDDVLKILEAARKQDLYWSVLDLMFETQDQWTLHHKAQPDILWKLLKRSKYDVARLRKEMNDPEIAKIIEQDIADTKLLGVRKTPSFFVNGKPLVRFGYDQLRALIDSELARNY